MKRILILFVFTLFLPSCSLTLKREVNTPPYDKNMGELIKAFNALAGRVAQLEQNSQPNTKE